MGVTSTAVKMLLNRTESGPVVDTCLLSCTIAGQGLGIFKLIQTRAILILLPENGNFIDLN